MSDREFIIEVKRALTILMRAMIRRYGLAWVDLLPREMPVPLPPIDTKA